MTSRFRHDARSIWLGTIANPQNQSIEVTIAIEHVLSVVGKEKVALENLSK